MATIDPFNGEHPPCAHAILARSVVIDVIAVVIVVCFLVVYIMRRTGKFPHPKAFKAIMVAFVVYGTAHVILFFPACMM